MATWGIVATGMAFVQGETSFYVMRFLLGVAEAGFFPGVVYYFTQWLPNSERGKAMAIFLSGSALASVISGPLPGGLMSIEGGGLHGWQWMFIIEGRASVALCFVVWFFLDSRPEDANKPKNASMFTLLKDARIALFCIIFFAIQLTIYGATFWLPSIIRKMGQFSELEVGLFNSIPWIISIAAMYMFATLAQKFRHQQAWVAVALIVAACGVFASPRAGR